jgi:hypothetical protein
MRNGYWRLYDAVREGKKLTDEEIGFHGSHMHTRRCIDLLRNALMCPPDLAIEVKDEKLGGVTGFGTERVCVNWQQLLDWPTEWETYKQKSNATRHSCRHKPETYIDAVGGGRVNTGCSESPKGCISLHTRRNSARSYPRSALWDLLRRQQ